ncbi:MAG: hypothetical protein V4614_14845 [Pseudomonadota bacterium]
MGEVITMETAKAMVRELFPDVSYPPDRFGAVIFEGYRFQAEKFASVLPELHPLHEQHYAETEDYLTGIPLDADYDAMQDDERAGRLIQFTARHVETGELVGNMRVYVSESRHNRKLFCTEDTFFVVPAHRGGFLAVRFWQFVEDSVRSIEGMRGVAFDSKLSNKADVMARYMKYTPVSTRHVKLFN